MSYPVDHQEVRELRERLQLAEADRDRYKMAWMEFMDRTDWMQEKGQVPAKYLGQHRADVLTAMLNEARAALATQPAAGEPEQQTAINAYDLPTKKYPLAAFDFDSPSSAPVAAGEQAPIGYANPKHLASMAAGTRAIVPILPSICPGLHHTEPVYAVPPDAAHGDEAVRKDAAAAYVAMSCNSVLIDGSTCYYLPAERMAAFDRMFSLGDAMRAQAGEGGEV